MAFGASGRALLKELHCSFPFTLSIDPPHASVIVAVCLNCMLQPDSKACCEFIAKTSKVCTSGIRIVFRESPHNAFSLRFLLGAPAFGSLGSLGWFYHRVYLGSEG